MGETEKATAMETKLDKNEFDWGSDSVEPPESIETALQEVRKAGDRKKAHIRTTVAAGATAALLIVVGIFAAPQIGTSAKHPANSIAAPSPSTSSSIAPVTQPRLSLAARVTQTAAGALANLKSVAFTEETTNHNVNFPDYDNQSGNEVIQFRATQDGSYWESTNNARSYMTLSSLTSYAVSTGKYTQCSTSTNQTNTSCAIGWVNGIDDMGTGPSVLTSFISAVENAQAGKDVTSDETTYQGKPAWTLQYDTQPYMSTQVEHVSLIVDQATGLPIHLETTVGGQPDMESSLTSLQVNPTLSNADLTVAIPKGASLAEGTPAQISATTFGASVSNALKNKLPITTADGFTTKEVWSTINGSQIAWKGNYKGDYVDQISRQGFNSYSVETIDLTQIPFLAATDMVPDFNNSVKVETITATQGALAGATFDVYQTSGHSLFIIGRNKSVETFIHGNLELSDVTSLVNNYHLG